MDDWVLRMPWTGVQSDGSEKLVTSEWLVTNGLGGYASGTVGGVASRRYHGLLIAALPAPLGRWVMLNHLTELVRLPGGATALLGGSERAGGELDLPGASYLAEFRLHMGLPVWTYNVEGNIIEKQVLLPHGQNTVHIRYRLLQGEGSVRLKLRPSLHFRPHEASVDENPLSACKVSVNQDRYELTSDNTALPPLRLYLHNRNPAFTLENRTFPKLLYRVEESRGYTAQGGMWSPGYFRGDLLRDYGVTLTASTESWETILSLRPDEAFAAEHERRRRLFAAADPTVRSGPAQELVLAADQFLITPAGRVEDAARARAAGDEVRTVIAGYHWFTDWGRDTMISLEGLTLTTGRLVEAGYILRTFAYYIRDGLIPNLFPEGGRQGLYHTADATLWYFHAIDRYVQISGDRETLKLLLPKLLDIVDHHVKGTRFGIGVDPGDGLLRQGEEGYQLTWMDAKVGDWVVTPRRGKAVEINALWFNALSLLANWMSEEGKQEVALRLTGLAERARRSFNERFWNAEKACLFDVVDGESGNDPACRPNQVLAISLEHPILDRDRWSPVMETVRKQLLTPLGLRSLSPDHPDYKAKYYGDLRARDAAYHQGTVWAWLIGPYVDAWLKLHPGDFAKARELLLGFVSHLGEAGIGSISEVFDAEKPFTPRGCIAQAWSVAEVLRCWAKTAATSPVPASGNKE